MNLLFYIEFTDGTETAQWSWADMRGITIPQPGDCICPGKGKYRIKDRTFAYGDAVMTVYFLCEPE